MRIGIDIDNTIVDTSKFILELAAQHGINFDADIDQYSEAELQNKKNLIKDYIDEVMKNSPIKEHAREVIQRLHDSGNRIYIITARSHQFSPRLEQITLDYLKKHDILYDELIFNCQDKRAACLKHKIDIMLDDNIDVMNSLEDSPVINILFSGEYNQGYSRIKLSSWKEFENYVSNIGGNHGKG